MSSHAALLEGRPDMATATNRYVMMPVDGKDVQTDADTEVEVAVKGDRTIKFTVAPTPNTERPPTGWYREKGGVGTMYHIIPVSSLWIDGKESQKIIAVAYSDATRGIFPLYPAVDPRKDQRGRVVKVNHSPMLYRAVEPDTGKSVETLHFTAITIGSAQLIESLPADA